MITMIVIALALGALVLFYFAVQNRRNHSAQSIRTVDIQALRTLMDRDDELFLREKLSLHRFWRLKRQRVRVTFRYVARISNNTAVVMRLGASARLNADPEVAHAAVQVMELAAHIRMQCLLAFAKLAIEFALPSVQLAPAALAPKYQILRENVLRLGALELQNVAPVAVAI